MLLGSQFSLYKKEAGCYPIKMFLFSPFFLFLWLILVLGQLSPEVMGSFSSEGMSQWRKVGHPPLSFTVCCCCVAHLHPRCVCYHFLPHNPTFPAPMVFNHIPSISIYRKYGKELHTLSKINPYLSLSSGIYGNPNPFIPILRAPVM